MSQKPVIAIMYDFDKTLCTKNKQVAKVYYFKM